MELGAPSVEGEAGGDVQEPVAQSLGLGLGELTVERQRLGPDDHVVREQHDLEPHLVELKLTGPELEASQVAAGRPFTTHEKLCQLVDYLRDSGGLHERREGNPSGDGSSRAFRLETGLAVRGVLPLAQPPLAVWVLEPPAREADSVEAFAVGRLFLLEDFAAPDEDGGRYRRMTSWSALAAMLQDWNRTGLGPQSVKKDVYRDFARDPLSVIESLGGTRGEPHTIRSLYRVRTVLLDGSGESSTGYAWTTVGYPIVIAEI